MEAVPATLVALFPFALLLGPVVWMARSAGR
jgi:hypothetical protein